MRLLTTLSGLATLAQAARLTVSIPPTSNLPHPGSLPASTHAVLIGPPGIHYEAPLRRDVSFVFDHLEPASYLLTIHAHDHLFPPLRVDVSGKDASQTISAWQTFRGNEWDNKGPSFGDATNELTIHVRSAGQKEFYQTRNGFSILSFLKSPMILMALFSVAVIFGMPYLMDSSELVLACEIVILTELAVDDETRAEFEEMQKKNPISGSAGAANQLQNFDLAGFLSGRNSQPEASTQGGSRR